jgi:photosynthetic reaction center H subunit
MLTESMDVAQVVLYVFWLFFFGLIFWLRREDRREGYPLETDTPRQIWPVSPILIPAPKTFILPHGGTATAPNFERDTRPIAAERNPNGVNAPLSPIGDPLLSGVGPASFAQRADIYETTREGHDLIIPMRVARDFAINAGPDPRGWNVVGADGKVAGVVTDLWVDRADVMVRYVEFELGAGGRRLIPMTMLLLRRAARKVEVFALHSDQFVSVPVLKQPDRITVLEEEKVSAFYAGGRLYAEARRLGPVL